MIVKHVSTPENHLWVYENECKIEGVFLDNFIYPSCHKSVQNKYENELIMCFALELIHFSSNDYCLVKHLTWLILFISTVTVYLKMNWWFLKWDRKNTAIDIEVILEKHNSEKSNFLLLSVPHAW